MSTSLLKYDLDHVNILWENYITNQIQEGENRLKLLMDENLIFFLLHTKWVTLEVVLDNGIRKTREIKFRNGNAFWYLFMYEDNNESNFLGLDKWFDAWESIQLILALVYEFYVMYKEIIYKREVK